MSFMFKPYPYVDPQALNTPKLSPELRNSVTEGNRAVGKKLFEATPEHGLLVLDGYVGAQFDRLMKRIEEVSGGKSVRRIDVSYAYKDSDELEKMLVETLPEDRVIDPILLFGKSVCREIESLFDPERVEALRRELAEAKRTTDLVILYGCGSACAALYDCADVTAFLDVTPLSTTARVQAGRVRALGDAKERATSYIFRRLYYFDYEIMMLHRKELIARGDIDFYIDSNQEDKLKLLPLAAFRELLAIQTSYPFRCTPVYLEGVWGGFFVKNLRSLPSDMRNCAWVFDMIPNEVSIQIKVGGHILNIPFSTFFKAEGKRIMGKESVERFGYVFPIRFNYDDTYGGSGNMSIQVHPPQAYNQEHFGEPFQQDESYYVVKTAGSKTYLGLQDDCDVEEFFRCIDRAEKEHVPFDHDRYVNSFPSEQGDQFLIPGGTIHASGRNQVVLEIGSYTIGSYTFKLYDYLRNDLDGNPLFDSLLHTYRKRIWPDAYKVNRISPRDVRDAPSVPQVRDGVESILSDAVLIVGYNHVSFDLPMMEANGFRIPDVPLFDVKVEYEGLRGPEARHRLVDCAMHYQVSFGKDDRQHTSKGDAAVTMECAVRMAGVTRGGER